MRVRGKLNLFNPIIFLLCLVLSTGFLLATSEQIISSASWYIAILLSFFIALFISSGIGMMFEERSMFGGQLLLAAFLPYLYFFWIQDNILRLDGVVPGLIAGVGFILHAFMNNRFDIVAKRTRYFLKLFFVGMMIYLFAILIKLVSEEDMREIPQYALSGSNDLFMVLLSFFALMILHALLMKYVHGIKASDVFVYGPSKSGKTLLLLSLYNQFVNYYNGRRSETIISSSREEDYYRIENMLAELKNGKQPKSNQKTDLTMYTLTGKKSIKPIEFSFVDYGGEFTENLTKDGYLKAILEISNQIPEIDKDALSEKIGNHEFIKELKEQHPDDIVYVLDQLVLAHVYKKLENAGKVVFLIDGEHIVSYHEDGASHLMRLFGQYSRIMEMLGDGKSYAIVVTKADKIKNITDVIDNSKDALNIEKEIFEMLTEIDTFKEIQHRATKGPIYFYAVSANALKSVDQQEEAIKNIYPWRVEQIAKFGF
jgi:GTPase SAR1 family protein